LIHQAPADERFTFIHRLRGRFTVKRRWRAEGQRELLELIVEAYTAYPAYGAEWITRELKRQGFEVGRRRVARLMREHGIAGTTRRKRRNLTKPDRDAAVVPDLVWSDPLKRSTP
jgi:transposase InsO family protein